MAGWLAWAAYQPLRSQPNNAAQTEQSPPLVWSPRPNTLLFRSGNNTSSGNHDKNFLSQLIVTLIDKEIAN